MARSLRGESESPGRAATNSGDGVDPAVVPGISDDDRALIRRMLALTPEQRLQGLATAAAFFRNARRA